MGYRTSLNDQSRFMRTVGAVSGLALGVILGGLIVSLTDYDEDADQLIGAVPIFVGCLLSICLSIGTSVTTTTWSRRVVRDLDRLGRAPSGVDGGPVPARVVQSRTTRRRTAAVVSAGRTDATPAGAVVVLTALPPDGPARRVAVLAPASVPRLSVVRRTHHLVHLVADRPEQAVLDVTGDPAALAAVAHDPRWTTERLPSTRTVVGGWGWVAGLTALGLVFGTLGGLLLVLGLRAL